MAAAFRRCGSHNYDLFVVSRPMSVVSLTTTSRTEKRSPFGKHPIEGGKPNYLLIIGTQGEQQYASTDGAALSCDETHGQKCFHCAVTTHQLAFLWSKFVASTGRISIAPLATRPIRSTTEGGICAPAVLCCFHSGSWRDCMVGRLHTIAFIRFLVKQWVKINEATASKSSPRGVAAFHPFPRVSQ